MQRLLLAGLCALAALPALALEKKVPNNWAILESSTDGIVFLNLSDIRNGAFGFVKRSNVLEVFPKISGKMQYRYSSVNVDCNQKRLRYDYLREHYEEAMNLARDKKGFVEVEHGSVDEKVYDAVCKGEYDKATVRSDNFDIETLVVWSQSLLYRANFENRIGGMGLLPMPSFHTTVRTDPYTAVPSNKLNS